MDRLIRDLIRTGRRAPSNDVTRIIDRMATAPFDPRNRSVNWRDRGKTYQGRTLASGEDSLFYHLVRRVMNDRQWVEHTMPAQYLADLRLAILDHRTHLARYHRRGGYVAVTLTATDTIVPAERRGADWLPELLVVFSADRGVIVTGYQVSGLEATSIPEDAEWHS